MRKEEPHEAYCGCINCRPLDTTDIPEKDDWPLFRPEEVAPAPSELGNRGAAGRTMREETGGK